MGATRSGLPRRRSAVFQTHTDTHRWVLEVNLRTAQACLGWMQEHGWDIGYMACSKRYLGRARVIDPQDPRLARFERIRRALDES